MNKTVAKVYQKVAQKY